MKMRPGDSPQTPTKANPAAPRTVLDTQETSHNSESNSPNVGWVMLPLRLFLGITFVYAGMQKLTDPQFFHKATPDYIGNQISAFAHGSPLHNVLISLILPHAVAFGWLIALGEIAVGIGTLCGILLRPAAFSGLLLSLIFFLTASWHVYPYFYGADIVFVFCWLTLLLNGPQHTGLPTVDTSLAKALARSDIRQRSPQITHLLSLLLGSTEQVQFSSAHIDRNVHTTWQGSRGRSKGINATRRKQEARRNFLAGALTGGASVFALTMIGYILRSTIPHSTGNSQTSNGQVAPSGASDTGTGQATAQTSSTAGAQASTVITQVSAVPKNSSFDFTLPSTGDPGILVHLANDQFVAYDAVCTHAGCQVGYDATSQHLVCPCHGAEFDPAQNAAVLQGPAPTPLTPVAISIDSATGAITLK
jgi:thiosulfate dehydrogenase [quinone] large subunit